MVDLKNIPTVKSDYYDLWINDININELVDADLCVQVKGLNDFYDLVFIKRDDDLNDNDIVAVVEHQDFKTLDEQVIKSKKIVLRRVIKIGNLIQLRDINDLYPPINLKENDHNIEILGKATYMLSLVH